MDFKKNKLATSTLIGIHLFLCLSSNIISNLTVIFIVLYSLIEFILNQKNKDSRLSEYLLYYPVFMGVFLFFISYANNDKTSLINFYTEWKIFLVFPLLYAFIRIGNQNLLSQAIKTFKVLIVLFYISCLLKNGFSFRITENSLIGMKIFPISFGSITMMLYCMSSSLDRKFFWSLLTFASGSSSSMLGIAGSIGISCVTDNIMLFYKKARLSVKSLLFILFIFCFIGLAYVIALERGRDIANPESIDRYMIYSSYLSFLRGELTSNPLCGLIGFGPAGGQEFLGFIKDEGFKNWITSFSGKYDNSVGYLLHSDYLRLFNSFGVIGYSFFIFLSTKVYFYLCNNGYLNRSKRSTVLIISAIATQSLLNSVLYTTAIMQVFCALIAYNISIDSIYDNKQLGLSIPRIAGRQLAKN